MGQGQDIPPGGSHTGGKDGVTGGGHDCQLPAFCALTCGPLPLALHVAALGPGLPDLLVPLDERGPC